MSKLWEGKLAGNEQLNRELSHSSLQPGYSESCVPSNDTDIQSFKQNNTPSMNPAIFRRAPWHVRCKIYKDRKKELGLEEIIMSKTGKIAKRARQRFKLRKLQRHAIAASILDTPNDIRPYAEIKIFNENKIGLLDSGASISILGKGSLDLLNTFSIKYTPYNSTIKTASGEPQAIIGKISTEVIYKERSAYITFFIAPTLSQEIYLGVDFWKKFEIAPDIFTKIEEILPLEDQKVHQLKPEQQQTLSETINLFPSSEILGLGKTELIDHSIDTGTAEPIKQRHYPYSPAMQSLIYEEVDRMLANGVIEESNSAWSSPIVLVRKPGKNRLCLDSRRLNSVTKKLAYPLPHIEGLLSRLSETRFISSVDLKDAFWQIELDDSSREKTAFAVAGRGLFHFKRMPFGLCNAAQRMSQLMDKVVPAKYRDSIFIYLDDLLIIAPDFDTHIEMLKICARLLAEAGLTINIGKSRFCMKELTYLGYIISDGHLRTDPAKIAAVNEFPPPKSPKQLRRFLGMTGWYRRFIRDFADISAPLTDCLKKSKKFLLSEEAFSAFEQLKKCLTEAPLLANADFSRPFVIQCDASTSGIGSVLTQIDTEGHEHPIYYFSKKLNKAQKSYTITELECLSAVESIKKFRPFVEGHPFKIVTDHASLQWLMSQRDLSGRLARWSLKLQAMDFTIEHRSGKENIVPDALSRIHCESILECYEKNPINFNSQEFQSDDYKELMQTIKENQERLPDLKVVDNLVYKRCQFYDGNPLSESNAWKLWVPHGLTSDLIRNAHDPPDCAHGGFYKTLMRLRNLYFWPSMAADIKKYTSTCEICKSTKPSNTVTKTEMGDRLQADRPFELIYIDFMGPYPRTKRGNCFIFVCLDSLSRFPILCPMRSATSKKVVEFLSRELFPFVGVPREIFSDNGSQFVSKTFQEYLSKMGILHLKSPFYTPQANAAERVNRSVLSAVRAYIKHHNEWDEHLPLITAALRGGYHQSLGTSPYFTLFGQHMMTHGRDYVLLRKLDKVCGSEIRVLPSSVRLQQLKDYVTQRLNDSHERNRLKYNLRVRETIFKEGDEIWRKNFILSDAKAGISKKFARKLLPCRIRKVLGRNRYEIEDRSGKLIGVYHGQNLSRIDTI